MFAPLRLPFAATSALLALVALALSGCHSPRPTIDVPPPPSLHELQPGSADAPSSSAAPLAHWAGTYQALLPQRAISVQLRENQTALVRERDLSQPGSPVLHAYQGAFHVDPYNPRMLTLSTYEGGPVAYRFFAGDQWLELRNRSTGAPLPQQQMFRLRKTSQP